MDALTTLAAPTTAPAMPQAGPPRAGQAGASFSQALRQARQPANDDAAEHAQGHDDMAQARAATRPGRAAHGDARTERHHAPPKARASGEVASSDPPDTQVADATHATNSRHDTDTTAPGDATALLQAPSPASAPLQSDAADIDARDGAACAADPHAGRALAASTDARQVAETADPRPAASAAQTAPAEDAAEAAVAAASPSRDFGAMLDAAMPRPAGADAAPLPPAATFGLPMGTLAGPTAGGPVPTDVPTRTVAPEVGSPGFAPALGSQVSLMLREGQHEARLQLHPAEMGPIVVQITLDGQAARVDFHADHAATRQALESSLPALAGALHESGLTLAGGGVFQGQPGPRDGQQAPATPGRPTAGTRGETEDDGATTAAGPAAGPLRARRGLVDLLA